jgi:hypothetical protein
MNNEDFVRLLALLANETVTIMLNQSTPDDQSITKDTCIITEASAGCVNRLVKEGYLMYVRPNGVHVGKL